MKPVAFLLFSVLVLFAMYSETNGDHHDEENSNCRGTDDPRCPQIMCGPDGPKGWQNQDNSKPYPECCGGPIC